MKWFNVLLGTLLFLCMLSTTFSTTVNGRFKILNTTNDKITALFQINTDTGIDDFGGATITFGFNPGAITYPANQDPQPGIDYVYHNFTNGYYYTATVTRPLEDQIWLNITLPYEYNNNGTIVAQSPAWTNVVTLFFDVVDPNQSLNLTWMPTSPFWGIYDGDNSSLWTAGDYSLEFDNVTWLGNITAQTSLGSKTLTYGQDPAATNGLDMSLGEFEIPPVPLPGMFDVRFNLPTTPTMGVWVDLRNTSVAEPIWELQFQPGLEGYPFTFTWDNSTLPEGIFYLRDLINGSFVNVDMKAQNSYVLTQDFISKLNIIYTGRCLSSDIVSGWNLISIPLLSNDMTKETLFPNANSFAFTYNNGYEIEDTLQGGKGYWLQFPDSGVTSVCGTLFGNTIDLAQGWNIVGVYDTPVPTNNIVTNPPNIIATYFFGLNDGYVIADTLFPGKGYWVRTNNSGTIDLSTPSVMNKETQSMATEEALVSLNFSITDGVNSKTLIIGVDTSATDGIDMQLGEYQIPPMPPAGVFDARLNLPDPTISSFIDYRQGGVYGGFNREHELQYQMGFGDSIIINYDFGPFDSSQIKGQLQDIATGQIINVIIFGTGSFTVPNPSVFNKLKLTIFYATGVLPVELAYFSGKYSNHNVKLSWRTETEINNYGFDVQRSTSPDDNWETIGFVNGYGNSNSPRDYYYYDDTPYGNYTYYRLRQIDNDGSIDLSSSIQVYTGVFDYVLEQNFPNPFNPTTTIYYQIPRSEHVVMDLFDMTGSRILTVINEQKNAGRHKIEVNLEIFPSAPYIYRIRAGNFVDTKKMILLK